MKKRLSKKEASSLRSMNCDLCGAKPRRMIKKVGSGEYTEPYNCIDHDHSCCGKMKYCRNCIRGTLCHTCNSVKLRAYEKMPVSARSNAAYNEYLIRRPLLGTL